jgi:hypothetical protein
MSAPSPAPAYLDDCEHVADELHWLDLVLKRRAAAFRDALRELEPPGPGQQMYITHAEIDRLLDAREPGSTGHAALDGEILAARERIDDRIARSLDQGRVPALVRLARLFRLAPFELRALTVCLAPELDTKYDKIYAYLHDDVTRKRPSVRLILDLLCHTPGERWCARAALTDHGALLRAGLLQLWDDAASLSGNGDLARFLRLDPAIVNFLLGIGGVEPRLDAAVSLVAPEAAAGDDLADPDLARRLGVLVGRHLDPARPAAGRLVVNFHGAPDAGARELALAVCRQFGWPLLCVDLEPLLDGEPHADQALRLALRQSLLWQAPVYLEGLDAVIGRDGARAMSRRLAAHIAQYCRLVFVVSARPWQAGESLDGWGIHRLAFAIPDTAQRERIWRRALRAIDSAPAGWAPALARQFRLTPRQIADAVDGARNERILTDGNDGRVGLDDIGAACRRQSRHVLADLAARVEPACGWEQLVLPADRLERLRELCAQLRHRQRVFEEWGFGARLSHGKGLSALFTGPPGTGKTMAAEVIAHDLGLDLYKVDLSAVVSKYIGETEKNLARIFKEAESSNAILFFDEADALFGKRTEVSDAHDRYANIETSFLLQKMEEYEGVVVLASNLRENMDEAFVRRLRFIVDFPFPDEAHRLRIWRTHFPPPAPVGADLDWEQLAKQIAVAGGNIKNIVLNAAFLAAAEGGAIGMRHVLHSARREFEKIGKRWDEAQMAKRATAAA